jgi:hypothetical protein
MAEVEKETHSFLIAYQFKLEGKESASGWGNADFTIEDRKGAKLDIGNLNDIKKRIKDKIFKETGLEVDNIVIVNIIRFPI